MNTNKHIIIYERGQRRLLKRTNPKPLPKPTPMQPIADGGLWLSLPRRKRWQALICLVLSLCVATSTYLPISLELWCLLLASLALVGYLLLLWLDYYYSAAGLQRSRLQEQRKRFEAHLDLIRRGGVHESN